jgi:hypothetical protein
MAGTPKYQQFIAKELKLNDIKDVSNDHGHPQFCDWKEEVIQLGNDLNCTIDSISYLVKIKKIVAEKLTRVYVVCLIQNTL